MVWMPTWDELSDADRLDLRLREIDAAEALLDVLPPGRDRAMVEATLEVAHRDLLQILSRLEADEAPARALPPSLVDRARRAAAESRRDADRNAATRASIG